MSDTEYLFGTSSELGKGRVDLQSRTRGPLPKTSLAEIEPIPGMRCREIGFGNVSIAERIDGRPE